MKATHGQPVSTLDSGRRRLREKYPAFVDSVSRVPIDPCIVPSNLREYIPYAEVWGVSGDSDRQRLAERAPQVARDDLVALVAALDDELDEWLAGPASHDSSPTSEYVAFSAMRMVADLL